VEDAGEESWREERMITKVNKRLSMGYEFATAI
jgi:hypothetical protein